MAYKVNVVIEKDDDGYVAFCPELELCESQGETLEEVLDNIQEAADLYVSTISEDEIRERISRSILTTSVEVSVA